MREKKNKGSDYIYHNLNRYYIRMKKKKRKENTRILFTVLKKLLNIMRSTNKLFDSLRPKLDFLGSYFDRLRVGEPTEYDINVVLNFPINYGKIKLNAINCQHDYTAIIMPCEFRKLSSTPATADQGFTRTQLWCDKQYRLSVKKFRAWMQSTVDGALHTLPLINDHRILKIKNQYFEISAKISGPANTITIVKNDGSLIDVDLVPTFLFQLPTKPLNSTIVFSKLETIGSTKNFYLVPKPSKDDFGWRVSFPLQERYLLKNNYYLKSTIRLLKHFRDVQGFTKLSSYFIKTLFLWECAEKDASYWKSQSLSDLVLIMLKKLKNCLEHKRISNFWCPHHNLLDKIKASTIESWYHRLCYVLKDIERAGKSNERVILQHFSIKCS